MFLHREKGNKQSKTKINYDDYIAGHMEPPEHHRYDISPELEDELLSNRFFLKRRVWKNMDKIKRSKATVDKPHREDKRTIYQQRHLSV